MSSEKNKALIAKKFSRRADQYEAVTPVQSKMADRLIHMVKDHVADSHPKRVLELGCGTGRLSRRILRTFPDCQLTAIDIAPDMIAKASSMVDGAEFIVADAEEFSASMDTTYDLIISNATAQWFESPRETLKSYSEQLNDHGLLAIATFANDTFTELHTAFRKAYDELGLAPGKHVHDLPGRAFWCDIFPEAEFTEEHFNLEFPDVRTFLHSVQHAGATHSATGRSTLSQSLYKTMSSIYRNDFSSPDADTIGATYHALYIMV